MGTKIEARCIIQIAGRPVETVQKALDTVVKQIKEDKKLKVIEEDIQEPTHDKESNLYSGFIELLIKFDDTRTILGFIADYTPSSIEIEDPSSLKFDSADFTEILNDMSNILLKTNLKLRQTQSIAFNLDKKLKELQGSKK